MPAEMRGRRIQWDGLSHPAGLLQAAGDYCGPVFGFTGNAAAVYYLLPNARDADAPGEAKRVHHCALPPHVATEEPDGTLTLRESIGAMPAWHGFLTEGRWELSKSKP